MCVRACECLCVSMWGQYLGDSDNIRAQYIAYGKKSVERDTRRREERGNSIGKAQTRQIFSNKILPCLWNRIPAHPKNLVQLFD